MNKIPVRIHGIAFEAEDIHAFDLRPLSAEELPPFTAGAHIDLHLPNGAVRSYSLSNSQAERHRYVVTIARVDSGRGGSRFAHEALRVGQQIEISPPRNNFVLIEDAPHTVLIAGGIGITPLWSMIQRLEELGASWELHYSTQTRTKCAYLERLRAIEERRPGAVSLNFDREPGGALTDVAALVERLPASSHIYCCGPLGMLEAFKAATEGRDPEFIHLEYFTPSQEAALDGGFDVLLARGNRRFHIPPGSTILDVLLDAGVDAPYSCMEGVCGSCEVSVLDGLPDHRDEVLTAQEKESGKTMMICCSGCKTDLLVLDL